MSQSLGKFVINVTDLDVDIAVFGGHKFGAPSGVGFMYLKDTCQVLSSIPKELAHLHQGLSHLIFSNPLSSVS